MPRKNTPNSAPILFQKNNSNFTDKNNRNSHKYPLLLGKGALKCGNAVMRIGLGHETVKATPPKKRIGTLWL